MAETYKILGQLATSDTGEYVLYVSPANTQAIITNVTVVNRTSSAQTFDINVYDSVVSNGTTSPAVNNVFKNVNLDASSTAILEPGITLGAQNSLVVRGTANTTFSVYGLELS